MDKAYIELYYYTNMNYNVQLTTHLAWLGFYLKIDVSCLLHQHYDKQLINM